ncbi:MAG TPA: hemerythrin domain-containing protein [Minicystis sp.]|nr:hemerythrin domain-containing protein [Minicystis sp.]
MLLPIGRARREAEVDDDPLAGFLACHARIRRFAEIAVKVAEHPEAPARDRAEAAEAVVRYFELALPLHVEDEEQSLAPRLVAHGDAAGLEAMRGEHVEIEARLAALLPVFRAVAEAPERAASPDLAATRALADLLERHLQLEEAVVFPAARRLPDADLRALPGELAARRTPRA